MKRTMKTALAAAVVVLAAAGFAAVLG